jgi:hypothetical protein
MKRFAVWNLIVNKMVTGRIGLAAVLKQRGYDIAEATFLLLIWYHFVSSFIGTDKIQIGGEYGVHIISLQNWSNALTCGLCMMWGNMVGGMPVFADPYGAFQHPLVMITTLLFGPLRAANTTLALSIFVMGFAGYLFCHTFQLHRVVRMWITVTMIYGGLIAGRLQIGSIGLPLSLSFAMLCFVYILVWSNNPTRKNTLILSVLVSMLLMAGQGYMQFAFVFILIPSGIYVYAQKKSRLSSQLISMFVIVGALIAPFVLTFFVNNASFGKDTDTTLSSATHIGFIMLNYVVDNLDYYNTALLGRQPYPYLYSNFIGYPVILGAFFAVLLAVVRHPLIDKFSSVIYLIFVNVLIVLVLASGDMQRWIIGFDIAPITQFVTGLRNLTLVASYAGGLMVLLAALCGDVLIKQLQVSNAMIKVGTWQIRGRAHWLVVCVMVWHVLTLYAYNKQFYEFGNVDPVTKTAAEFLKTQPLGGVNVETNYQVFSVVEAQRKVITQMFYPWFLINGSPAGELYYMKSAPPDMSIWQELKRLDDTWVIYKSTDVNQQYALHTSEQKEMTPCEASGTGGDIDVWCTAPSTGILRIYENNLGSWQAWVDDIPTEVTDVNKFVAVNVAGGKHHIAFRYRPWYTILGLAISWGTWVVLIVYAGIAVVQMINSKRTIPVELPSLNAAIE